MSVPIFTKDEGPYTLKEIIKIVEETDNEDLAPYMECIFDYKGSPR